MSRGASLPAAHLLGFSPRSDTPPTEGNDFFNRYHEDLALFAELGVTDLRLGLDWSRLQPSSAVVDHDWREWYQRVIEAAGAHGIGVWLGLVERSVPAWFADDGGFTDAKIAGRFWPRYVELCTELFGDRVAGWVPMHDPIGLALRSAGGAAADGTPKHLDALTNLLVGWRDAWRLLRGGPPVATSLGVRTIKPADESVPALQAARLEDQLRFTLWLRALRDGVVSVPTRNERVVNDLGGSLDVLGIAFGTDLGDDPRPTDGALGRWQERAGGLIRRAAEQGPDRPVSVTYRARRSDDDERRSVTEALGGVLSGAVSDGIRLGPVFWEPGIDSDTDATGPISRDREVKSSAVAWPTV